MTELTAELIVDMAVPSEVRLSPDGRTIAFTVAPVGRKHEHPRAAIWVVPSDGSKPARRFTAGTSNDVTPRWSHDGTALYFLSDRATPGTLDLYRLPIDGGEAERLTTWKCGVYGYDLHSDGTRIVFSASDPKSEDDERRTKERDDTQVFGETWRPARLRILTLEAGNSAEPVTLTASGHRHVASFSVSPDGQKIAVMSWPTPELNESLVDTKLHIVDLANDRIEREWQLPGDGGLPNWNRESNALWFLGHHQPRWRAGLTTYRIALTDDAPAKVASDLDACPFQLETPADAPPFLMLASGLDSQLARLDPAGGSPDLLQTFTGSAYSLSATPSGDTIALIVSSGNEPPEIWSGPPTGPLEQLTGLNPAVREIAWGDQERLEWTASDGLALDGLFVYPSGKPPADAPFPTIVLVHGGPYGRWTDALQISWAPNAQWLATAGYAVFLPNPRGGMGHGSDFADRVSGTVGLDDWTDIVSGIDALVERGLADPERLAIGGWSQGGFMTAWAVGQTDRFKAGVMGAGVSDWGLMVAESDILHFEGDLGGSFGWEGIGPHHHDRLSPISFAHRVSTPVLILHGGNDGRVPVSQGRFFARALRYHGVPFELAVYPREPHAIKERNHQIDLLNRTRAWYDRWLGACEHPEQLEGTS